MNKILITSLLICASVSFAETECKKAEAYLKDNKAFIEKMMAEDSETLAKRYMGKAPHVTPIPGRDELESQKSIASSSMGHLQYFLDQVEAALKSNNESDCEDALSTLVQQWNGLKWKYALEDV